MSKVWTDFNEALDVAKALAKKRGEEVLLEVVDGGWAIYDYCSWVNELGEHTDYRFDDDDDRTATTGLSRLDWEDNSPDEVNDPAGG